jgi:hypothetical protein
MATNWTALSDPGQWDKKMQPFPKGIRAPALPSDPSLWINTGGQAFGIVPNRINVLEFWTFC